MVFTERDRLSLLDNGVSRLFAPIEQHEAYRTMLIERLESLFRDSRDGPARRGEAVRRVCAEAIEDVLQSPGQREAIEALHDVGNRFEQWLGSDPVLFEYLLDMSAHDYGTLTHMVNVGVGCGILAREVEPEDDTFILSCIMGGLLHDLGKRGVPEGVLSKEGRLDGHEWRLLKRHPELAHDELSKHDRLTPATLEMVRDHHERLDGTGYPRGIVENDISKAARICAIVDSFDAVSSRRPYRGPIHPLATLDLLKGGSGTLFDPELLRVWSKKIRRLLKTDPSRSTLASSSTDTLPSLHHLLPRPFCAEADQAESASVVGQDDRRRFERHACRAPVRAMFLRQGKLGPVLPGELFELDTVDVGKGGLQLEARWPFSLGDVILLFVPQGGTRTLRLHARVVRVRSAGDDDCWTIGVRFIDETELLRTGMSTLRADTRRAS